MTTPATAIEELRRLLEASTPGEWEWPHGIHVRIPPAEDHVMGRVITTPTCNDAHFIAAARNTLPLLFAELDRLREDMRKLRSHDPTYCAAILSGAVDEETDCRDLPN